MVVPDDFWGEFNVDSDSSRRDAEEVEKEGLGFMSNSQGIGHEDDWNAL